MSKTNLIAKGNSWARINELGLHIGELVLDGHQVLKTSEDGHQTHGGCAFLIPYANRIRNGTYYLGDERYGLTRNAEGNSIHGFGKDLTWAIRKNTEDNIEGNCLAKGEGYPFDLRSEISMAIGRTSLKIEMRFRNNDNKNIPLSPGAHPYFNISQDWKVHFGSPIEEVEYADKYFPNGNLLSVEEPEININGKTAWDNCFKGGGCITLKDSFKAVIINRINMNYFVLYNGLYSERKSVAIEPMVAPPDSFNNGISLVMLKPGEEFRCGFEIIIGTP
ncbi:MAG: aldose epimerase family protein [Thermoplasmataceae archaeon]